MRGGGKSVYPGILSPVLGGFCFFVFVFVCCCFFTCIGGRSPCEELRSNTCLPAVCSRRVLLLISSWPGDRADLAPGREGSCTVDARRLLVWPSISYSFSLLAQQSNYLVFRTDFFDTSQRNTAHVSDTAPERGIGVQP